MPDINFHFEDDHTRVQVGGTLLTGGNLNICLLQLPPTVDEALEDLSRPRAVGAIRDLLIGGPQHAHPALQDMVAGAGPVMIVAPEYALGSGDWDEVDALVRSATRPLILLTGFGATDGQTVLDWQGAEIADGTERHLSWRQEDGGVSPILRVNGGWCWIHEPGGETQCIVYLKNFLQQGYEAANLPDLQVGEKILHLRYDDIDVFPLICADLIQPAAQHPGSPQQRVQSILVGSPANRPALVVGSLLQLGYNENWGIAVSSLLNTVLTGRPGAVALCNIAHDDPTPNEANDKWRSLTGVLVAYGEYPKGQAELPVARVLKDQGITGAVVRQTHACAAAGVISWSPYDPIAGAFVWRGNTYCPIEVAGLAGPVATAPTAAACEIDRFLRRHPPAAGSAPRLGAGIAMIGAQLRDQNPPRPSILLSETLDGIQLLKPRCPDSLDDAEVTSALTAGLHAIATLRSIDGIEWQRRQNLAGQLTINEAARHLLVWRSPKHSPRAMRRQLASWRLSGGPHPDLIVVGGTPTGDLPDGDVGEERRDDISQAPAPEAVLQVSGTLAASEDNITSPQPLRRVVGLGMSRVADVYADFEANEDEARVTTLLGQITSFFQEGAGE